MKTSKYNKSAIMREAHYMRKVLKLTMSEALKMVWNNAKIVIANKEARIRKEQEYTKMAEVKAARIKMADMSYLANTLTSYYANNAYNMD